MAIKDILLSTLEPYSGEALNGYLYLMVNEDATVFTITSIAKIKDETIIETGIVARVEGGMIIIERDISNKPLVDALIQAGVSRENIVLAYAGEKVPTTT